MRPDNTFTTNDFFICDSSPLLCRILLSEDKYGTETRKFSTKTIARIDLSGVGQVRISVFLTAASRNERPLGAPNWRAATINRKLHCLFRANKSSKKISLARKESTGRGGEDDDRYVRYMRVCATWWPPALDGCYERTISLPARRIAHRHAPLYERSISILGKSTLGIENGNERASEGVVLRLQEVGGQRVGYGWLCARGRISATERKKAWERVPCLRRGMQRAFLFFF